MTAHEKNIILECIDTLESAPRAHIENIIKKTRNAPTEKDFVLNWGVKETEVNNVADTLKNLLKEV